MCRYCITLTQEKRIYSFDYCDGFEKLNEGLPSKDKFHKSLANCEISDEDCDQQVFII